MLEKFYDVFVRIAVALEAIAKKPTSPAEEAADPVVEEDDLDLGTPEPEAEPELKLEDVQAAMREAVGPKQERKDKVIEILKKKFKVARASDLKPADYAAAIAEFKKVKK